MQMKGPMNLTETAMGTSDPQAVLCQVLNQPTVIP